MRNAIAFSALLAMFAGCGPTGRDGQQINPNQNPNCPAACVTCAMDGTCQDCMPGVNTCSGDSIAACNSDGTIGATVQACDTANNERCAGGSCLSPCDVAANTHSYIGCDYWPVTTVNAQLNPYFDFAVAVANPLSVGDVVQSASAHITITRGNTTIKTQTVAPGDVATITLPWVSEISQNANAANPNVMTAEASVLMADGAYHLVSDLPVTVYQFNPLQFEKPATATCMDQPMECQSDKDCGPGGMCDQFMFTCTTPNCHSYSNDASILLPTTALNTDYIVISRQTFSLSVEGGGQAIPGFYAIVATEDNTMVNVTYTAFTEPGATGTPAAASPNDMVSYMLNKGTVLEVVSKRATSPCANTSSDMDGTYCDLGPRYDLSGTRISASKNIAVFGGHSCSFVPYDKWACDHLETQLTPTSTWGQTILAVQTRPEVNGEPNVFRVFSATAGNQITFEPAVHAATTLGEGEYVEFVAQGGFKVNGSGHTAVGQYMVGEQYTANPAVTEGDPSLGLGVPIEQYRDSYDFLTPSTYTHSYLTLIAPTSDTVMLDGNAVPNSYTAIGTSGYGFQYIEMQPGAHHVSGTAPFGITIAGVAPYTSYLLVGGQNLNDIPLQ